jgi:2-methylisocitrate lyase-like PEP mutase family enzyme
MDLRRNFRKLHESNFILPNPWDLGSARILASMGFEALATTSAGFAATLGRQDGAVSREEAIAHASAIASATPLPVSADLENGFGDAVQDVEETILQASTAGLAGCSIEDFGPTSEPAIYERGHATDRIRAAVAAAQKDPTPLVLTARAENYIRGNPDLADTIARLQDYQEAGADVLYAPGLIDLGDVRSVASAVDRPLNALLLPGGPTVAALFEAGVARVSLGSVLSMVANAALVEAARELLDDGTHEFWTRALAAGATVNAALSDEP